MQISLANRSLQHIWHPCSQMKDYETFPPLEIAGTQGSYLLLNNGKKIIDAIASWWCKSLGHQHPRIRQALIAQAQAFEHLILANTTNAVIVELSEKLASLTPHLKKIMYASDGSSAVEIALKMSAHTRKILNEHERTHFISLKNSYHGETLGAMSVSDLGLYRDPYTKLLFKSHFIEPCYVHHNQDPLWQNSETHWRTLEKKLQPFKDITTAVIVEPIIQAAGAMQIYSKDFLRRLRLWTREHGIHLIADEIMTGFGRAGKMLAFEHAQIEPDFVCLGKGLTAGWLPFSATLTTDTIYQLFYADYQEGKSFLHSHTHSGNVLAARVALEVWDIMQEEAILVSANHLGKNMYAMMRAIATSTQKLKNVRSIGALVAADLISENDSERLGFKVFQKAMSLGAFLRPLGNTIYWCPPLNMEQHTLEKLASITEDALKVI